MHPVDDRQPGQTQPATDCACAAAPRRHRALPLVSRRCRQLVCSPQLLHTVNVQISGDTDEQAMSRLRSLAQFLLQHGGGSVRQLRLNLGRCGRQQDDQIESMALMAAAATACSGLEELVLEALFIMPLSSWLLPLSSSLRRLEVGSGVGSVLAGPLAMMTALQELEFGLYGDYVDVEADGCLPTSLTSLTLGSGDAFKRVPSKVRRAVSFAAFATACVALWMATPMHCSFVLLGPCSCL